MNLPERTARFTLVFLATAMVAPLSVNAGGSAGGAMPSTDEGPALSSYAEQRMDLGYASHDSGTSNQDKGDGAVTVVIEDADGNPKVVKMDPISGAIQQKPAQH